MAPSRKSWSFTIHLYWDFSKSWSQIQKVGVNYSKFGVNETSDLCKVLKLMVFSHCPLLNLSTFNTFEMYVQSCTVLLQNLARIFSLFTENKYLAI